MNAFAFASHAHGLMIYPRNRPRLRRPRADLRTDQNRRRLTFHRHRSSQARET